MSNVLYENILGKLVFNEKGEFLGRKMPKRAVEPTAKQLDNIMRTLKQKEFHKDFISANIAKSKADMRGEGKEDILIIEAIKSIGELEKVKSMMLNRLREWYAYYNPEFVHSISNMDKFLELVVKKDKKTLLKEVGVSRSMGIEISSNDANELVEMAKGVQAVNRLRERQEKYLSSLLEKYMPNTTKIAGHIIAGQLMEIAGSLKELMEMPSSTIQLLGAEKSLFRHLKNKKNRAPKYGVLYNHQMIQKVRKENRGKAARLISSKIDIALKVDYFKGKYVGDVLLKDLEKKVKGL